ncbi:dapper 1-like [Lampris incognitus]|uniref:dapper 1-like n=1 Tax=Lampris incognitus TaxID=2546036 RepID=UPI0024B56993|nr:dapper 1-like [Lampris incognitus]
MHRAFSYPMTAERSRTKERLEASVAGLCELELRRQRQEALVLGALALGDPMPHAHSASKMSCFSSWGEENLTLRRQLSALQTSPWGLIQVLEQQVGELRIDTDNSAFDGVQGGMGDSRPCSGFCEPSEGQSPKERSCSTELTESASSWAYNSETPKSLDALNLNGEHLMNVPAPHATLPRSFSALYPPLQGIAEEAAGEEFWQWEVQGANQAWHQQSVEDQVSEEDYEQAVRVEGYILGLIQRHTLLPRPCQPRTSLNPDLPYCGVTAQSTIYKKTPSHTPEHSPVDLFVKPPVDLSTNPESQGWGCDLLQGEACGGEAPSLEEGCYLAMPYPHSSLPSMAGGQSPSLPSLDPNCDVGSLDLCHEAQPPQHHTVPYSQTHHNQSLVSAQYIPGQGCHAPVRSPRHFSPVQPKSGRDVTSPEQPSIKSKTSKKNQEERQRSRNKTSRSQSDNSLQGHRVLPERRYSTTERPQARREQAHNQDHVAGTQAGYTNSSNGSRRWCSNLELSQDEGDVQLGQAYRRPPRKARHDYISPSAHLQTHHHRRYHGQPRHSDFPERAPLCRGEEGSYAGAAPGESESSMSEVYSPASSSLSSDSDESGGLVWPQQLPPRLVPSSSSSSSSPQATANTSSQPKAFIKIKASHALKKKILRFRSGSLKVMTTV